MSNLDVRLSSTEVRFVPSDILNAESVDKYLRTCLAEACRHVRDDLRDYVRREHYVTGELLHSIKYKTWKTKKYGFAGKVYIDDRNQEVPHTLYITQGTSDWLVTPRGVPEGRKKAINFFSKKRRHWYTLREGTWRRGIDADDFFERIVEDSSSDIDYIFDEHMENLVNGNN